MRPHSEYVYIDSDMAKRILADQPLSYTQIGFCLQRSDSWLSYVLKAGRMAMNDIESMRKFLNIDLTSCVIDKEQWDKPKTVNVQAEPIAMKTRQVEQIISDYSYERSNDSDRIANAIDRLTETLGKLVEKL